MRSKVFESFKKFKELRNLQYPKQFRLNFQKVIFKGRYLEKNLPRATECFSLDLRRPLFQEANACLSSPFLRSELPYICRVPFQIHSLFHCRSWASKSQGTIFPVVKNLSIDYSMELNGIVLCHLLASFLSIDH